MHHETELTREKTQDEHQAADPAIEYEAQSTQSDTDSEGRRSSSQDDVVPVNFQPGEPADPHNWSLVSPNNQRGYFVFHSDAWSIM